MVKFNLQSASRIILVAAVCLSAASCDRNAPRQDAPMPVLRLGVSPFQDTYLPVIGVEKGWYKEEKLDVQLSVLGWTEVMEALSAGRIDVGVNNLSSVISTHDANPNLVYWYGLNPFDNGFALMIRPNGALKTVSQFEHEGFDHATAVKKAAAQLKGKKVITTANTDMEQGVAATALRGGLNFKSDIKIVDLNPDEGLAAFLRGEGDAYIGGIPQRTRAGKDGMLEMVTGADLGPPPINGFVTTKAYAQAHQDELLTLLHVWFRTVQYVNANMDEAAKIVVDKLNQNSGGQFTVADFKGAWNNFEHYPASAGEVQKLILDPNGRNYWKAAWDDCNQYFATIKGSIPTPVSPTDAFLMVEAQAAYMQKYGNAAK